MTPGELDDAVQTATAAALAALGGGSVGAEGTVGRARVRRPRHPEQGDYASPVALRLAQETGLPAAELARAIAAELGRHPGVRRAEAAGPGFVSIWLTARASGDLAGLIVTDGQTYGRSDRLAGQCFRLDPPPENPPPTTALSHARHGALAAATGRLLRAAGAGLSAVSGPGVTSLRIPGPAATGVSPADRAPATLGELVAAVGAGAAWYALVSWPPGVPVEIDLAVWARQTSVSPAGLVRHTRQRIKSLDSRVAAGIGLESGFDPTRLTAREETALLNLLADLPAVVAVAGRAAEPHRVARYLESVAAAWSACGETCPVLPRRGKPEPGLTRARVMLAQAADTVLASGLSLLGVTD